MSVAYDLSVPQFRPEVVPGAWRPGAVPTPSATPAGVRGRPVASVSVLHAPTDVPGVSLRLTRRGQVVLAVLVALAGAALWWAASASAPVQAASARVPARVTVQPGDTLWSIASRVAPQADPRAEVADLQQRNHLVGVDVVPGEVLQVR